MKAKNRQRTPRRRGEVLLITVLLLGGCSGSRVLNMTVKGSSDLNSCDETPGGNAAIVRIYQLSNDTNFRTVTLEAFWNDDSTALGNEMTSSRQLRLFPNDVKSLEIEPDETAQFIGVAADLRCPDPERWRQVCALSELKGKQITVEINRDRVAINVQCAGRNRDRR